MCHCVSLDQSLCVTVSLDQYLCVTVCHWTSPYVSLCVTHPSIHWVGSCQHTAPGIESSVYPSLGYGDTALLHHLMDGSAVNVTHLSRGGGEKEGEDS